MGKECITRSLGNETYSKSSRLDVKYESRLTPTLTLNDSSFTYIANDDQTKGMVRAPSAIGKRGKPLMRKEAYLIYFCLASIT